MRDGSSPFMTWSFWGLISSCQFFWITGVVPDVWWREPKRPRAGRGWIESDG
jgi:hypothetical protein